MRQKVMTPCSSSIPQGVFLCNAIQLGHVFERIGAKGTIGRMMIKVLHAERINDMKGIP